jgi:hypothetical protein
MKFVSLLATAAIVILSGCAAPVVPLNFSVPNVGLAQRKIDAEMKSLTVTVARPDEKTGVINMNPTVPTLWTTSLTEAFNKMTIFQDDAPKKVNVAVKILSFDPPGAGFSMTTTASARYEIIDRKNGDIIFTQDISSSGTTPADYAFLGVTRQIESANRAVQNNITQFLQALETVDVKKPMFPAKAGATQQ